MTTPLPAAGSTNWYPWAQDLDALARAAAVLPVLRTPEQYGAVGDGVADDQIPLANMLAALTAGNTIRMAGRYRHTASLTVPNRAGLTFDGTGGALLATNRLAASFRMVGLSRLTLRNIRHIVDPFTGLPADGRGNDDSATTPFYLVDCTDVQIEDCVSENSAQTGFYLANINRFRVLRPNVLRSYADGFHMTHNSRNGYVDSPTIWFPGDDGVAVVSYRLRDAVVVAPCRDIIIRRPSVRHCHARGISIIGGINVVYYDVDLQWTRAAGAMIATESSYDSSPVDNCHVRGGKILHSAYPVISSQGVLDAALDHGPMFMSGEATRAVTNSSMCDIEVTDVGPTAFDGQRAIGAGHVNNSFARNIFAPGGREVPSLAGLVTGVTAVDAIDNRGPQLRRMGADVSSTVVATGNSGIGWGGLGPGTYVIEISGSYLTAVATTGIKFNWGFAGTSTAFDCAWDLSQGTTAAPQRGVTTGTNTEFIGAGSAATVAIPFTVEATAVLTGASNVFDFKFGSEIAASSVTLKRGTFGRLTKIA